MATEGRTTLASTLLARINDNAAGEISAADVRAILTDMIDSDLNQTDDDVGTFITGSDPEGSIYQRNAAGSLIPAAISESATRVTATKSLETPPSALLIGSGITLSSGLNTIVFKRAGGTAQSIVSMIGFDSTGSDTPVFYDLATEVQFPVTTTFDTQLTEPVTITFVPAVADSFVTKFMFRPAEAGTLRVRGYTGTDTTGDLVVDESFTVAVGDVGTNVEFEVPSPVLSFVGDQFTVEASGIDVFGGNQTDTGYSGQTLPFVTLIGHVVTQVQYTSPNTLVTHVTDGDETLAQAVISQIESQSGSNRLKASAIQNLPTAPTNAPLHFTQAIFTNSTRVLEFTRDNGSTLDVVIPESTSGFLAPRITEFTLPNTASRIGTTDDLIGDLDIQFHISNSADQDTLSLLANSVNVGAVTTFTPDGLITGQSVNISSAEWTSITTADSTQVQFQLSGPDKNTPTAGTTTSNIVTVQIADLGQDAFFYYGTSTSNNPASVDVSTLTSLEASSGTFTLDAIDPAQNDWIILLAPQDHDLTALVNTGINRDVLSLYTETTSVRTLNGQLFDSYVLGPTNDTPGIVYQATLA